MDSDKRSPTEIVRRLADLDERGVRWARSLPHPSLLNTGLVTLSKATDHSDAWLVLGLCGAVLDTRQRARWLRAGAEIALVDLSSRAIKRLLPRVRPRLQGLPPLAPTPSPMSFPSSHTAAAVAAIDAFSGLVPGGVLRLIALLSAFSRLYLGVHYPSDIAVGAGLGFVLGRGLTDSPGTSRPLLG
jgi:membrane-associated phospholipid phosphatase